MTHVAIDSAWIAANPPPVHGDGTTKNSRGHVVIVGGARLVPGAPRLTAEAALRAGAGKVQVATIASAAILLGVMLPEAGIIALPEDGDGEIAAPDAGPMHQPLDRCDTVVIGPGMGSRDAAIACARAAGAVTQAAIILDAAAIAGAPPLRERWTGDLVLTPNHQEMALLLDTDEAAIADDPAAAALDAAQRFGATVLLKGRDTHVAQPDGGPLYFPGGGVGLATGGSGDVLAGAVAGLLSRGASPLIAAGWGIWLHGQAARRLAAEPGPIGFLARELPGQFPRLLPQ